MKVKVTVTVNIDKDNPKYCGTECPYGNFAGNVCTLRGENGSTEWLSIDKGSKSKRSAYCRRREVSR